MVNKIDVEILGEGTIDNGSEKIPVENIYLMKNITTVDDKDYTDTEFALKFKNNKDYYKVKELGAFNIDLKNSSKTLKKCELFSPEDNIDTIKEFKGITRE
ncbi:hypothetical protein ALNOE001_03220 [Candidatus Methanobinarius endosymbioticus]|uniref:Uncharacterized protein n=1 Tax=Candidatus Methanobinarius endosymbioticus TaxID=2006182 RepID=A0A366MEV6_9EURY|nr:hypothetical protein ALNOE001_03220 [Candidatus Methanobinarius endosymbioticus]